MRVYIVTYYTMKCALINYDGVKRTTHHEKLNNFYIKTILKSTYLYYFFFLQRRFFFSNLVKTLKKKVKEMQIKAKSINLSGGHMHFLNC